MNKVTEFVLRNVAWLIVRLFFRRSFPAREQPSCGLVMFPMKRDVNGRIDYPPALYLYPGRAGWVVMDGCEMKHEEN